MDGRRARRPQYVIFRRQDLLRLRDHFCRVVGHLVDMRGPNPTQEGLRPDSAS